MDIFVFWVIFCLATGDEFPKGGGLETFQNPKAAIISKA
jgi:hypothetical protein